MEMAGPERTRLFVEGVQTPITTDLIRRRGDGLVVSQALPFLRLGTVVRETDGTRARIGRVAIAMDGDVPRLLIELEHEAREATLTPAVGRAAPPVTEAALGARLLQRADDTVPDTVLKNTVPHKLDDTVPSSAAARFALGVSARPPRTESTVPYDLRVTPRSAEERTEIVVTGEVRSPARASRPPSLWSRMVARIAALVASFGRRALPAG